MSLQLFPEAFEKRVLADNFLGKQLLDALNQPTPISIRFNPTKNVEIEFDSKPINWCSNAYYLSERPKFTLDPLFHSGVYYPQEAGSMFLESVLKQLDLPNDPIILDLCAAPGGKSSLISSFLNNKGLLISNEVIQSRSKILKENLIKWGNQNTIVTNNDPKDFNRIIDFFDCIVVDAPCSGEGMFRKDLEARKEWNEANVDLCASRQRRIVMDVWNSLKPNGYLVYSTCTFNSFENEDNIKWFLANLSCEITNIDPKDFKNGRENIGAYSLPHLLDAEGFYICVLKKVTNNKPSQFRKNKNFNKNLKISKNIPQISKFINSSNAVILEWNSFLFATPINFTSEIICLQENLRILKLGTELGTLVKNDLIPNHSLAMDNESCVFVDRIELNKIEALQYLKGETFPLIASKGYHLVCYKNIPLGWIKHIGTRFNNLYPKEWRIRISIN